MSFNKEDPIIQMMVPEFISKFGCNPEVAGRAPGRVNLIGEHIDYCGFPVFPMALKDKHTTVLISLNDSGKINCKNTDPANYPDAEVNSIAPESELVSTGWSKYVESAIKEYCKTFNYTIHGINILVHGTVPIASGLSSSAALLCSIVIALNALQNVDHDKQALINCSIEAEHRVGMNCGGMDQSISILGQEGYALIIGFSPPSTKLVKLPDAHFIVAHCMKKSAKVEGYDENCYNHRVLEVRRAAELMAANCKTIGDVVKSVGGFDKAIELAEKLPQKEGNLVLRDRALHVLTEAQRVLKMENATLDEWGTLMCESHRSCRDLYHCSCEELDELVEEGLKDGAIGGRLTGAGWGGCAIFLLRKENDPQLFIEKLKKGYYERRKIENPIVFATKPGQGAEAFKF
ncbi:galactokinase family protein [Histomonas meleagridis]|uniref:galactokinase family protein n=1 Tax=Histomonas meleagridis TaxID=135588 RepID=UPI003559E931|nr:galactokinase family protein [Histomonas meleagridis]KAH0806859.1 galactokinase family protein [Histomonas meleagridis]